MDCFEPFLFSRAHRGPSGRNCEFMPLERGVAPKRPPVRPDTSFAARTAAAPERDSTDTDSRKKRRLSRLLPLDLCDGRQRRMSANPLLCQAVASSSKTAGRVSAECSTQSKSPHTALRRQLPWLQQSPCLSPAVISFHWLPEASVSTPVQRWNDLGTHRKGAVPPECGRCDRHAVYRRFNHGRTTPDRARLAHIAR